MASASLTAGKAHGNRAAPSSGTGLAAGAFLPLSGDFALAGDECLRGIQLATAEVFGAANAAKILQIADAANDDAPAIDHLIKTDSVQLLFGSGTSALSYAGSAAAELGQIPYIELNATADGITARGFKFLLRTCPTTKMIADYACLTLANRFAGRKIGLLFNTGAAEGAIAAALVAALKLLKLPVTLAVGYPEDLADLYEPVGRLSRAGVEVLLHAGGVSDIAAFFVALQLQSWQPGALIGCGNGYLTNAAAAAVGPKLDGTLVIGPPPYDQTSAPIAKLYIDRFGMPPRSSDSLLAFIGAKIILDTLKTTDLKDNKLFAALRKIDLPVGALDNGFGISFDQSGQNTRSFVTLQKWQAQKLIAAG